MADTVSIPADKARDLAQYHRDRSNAGPHVVSHDAARWHRETADLLDPPPTLRQLAIRAINSAKSRQPGATVGEVYADDVLAVVAVAAVRPIIEAEVRERIATEICFASTHDGRHCCSCCDRAARIILGPHEFTGRTDRWCDRCNLPDRNPIHAAHIARGQS